MRKAAWFCLSFSGTAALCVLLTGPVAAPLGMLCALVLGMASMLLRGKTQLRALLLSAGVLAGCLCVWVQDRLVIRPAEALTDQRLSVSARVTEFPDIYDGSTYVTVRLTQPGVAHVKCRLASYEEGELEELVPGDEIVVPVRFRSAAERNGEEIDVYFAQNIFTRAVCTGEVNKTGRWRYAFLYYPRRLSEGVYAESPLMKTHRPLSLRS